MISGLVRDVRYALRMLLQQPVFTVIALLTLALGIGATTAIFSVVNAVVLRPLPYPRSERLVLLFENNLERGWTTFSVAPANFADWAREARTFQSMTAFGAGSSSIVVGNEALQVPSTTATSEYFRVIQATPALGRIFEPTDDVPGAAPVAVIGHGFWQRRFGGDRHVIGQAVSINDRPTTIVGVMKEGFGRGGEDMDLWLPLTINRAGREGGGRTLNVLGRLADGATLDQAQSEMDGLAKRLGQAYPSNTGWGITLLPLEQAIVSNNIRRALAVLFGAVVFVLLIACVNVASLLSARGVARRRELAIRRALGASRWRLLRQLVTESMVLSIAGCWLGILVAVWSVQLLAAIAPRNLPRIHEVSVDMTVLGIALVAAVLAALIFGVGPALQVFSARPQESLTESSRGDTGNPARRRLNQVFVVVEIAMAVVLLVGSGLLIRSFIKLANQPLGFDPDRTLVFRLNLPEARYPSPEVVTQFYRDAVDRIRAIPGVRAAGATHALPFSGMNSVRPFVREGDTLTAEAAPTADYRLVTPGYFAALGIPVIRGREFNESDRFGQPGAAIVNESFVRKFLGDRDPLATRIKQAGGGDDVPWLTIVGVVGDVRHSSLRGEMQPEMFWPEAQATWGTTLNRLRRGLYVAVRTDGDPANLIPTIRAQVASLDPNRPMIDAQPMRDLIVHSADVPRFSMTLITFFAITGLVLAVAGVYGLTSYVVASRRREMGIRLALGAKPRSLLLHIMRGALVLAALGSALGLVVAWQLDEFIRTQLFQVAPRDPLTFAVAAIVLVCTAVLASILPARRAAAVDPVEALRD
jgi:putative ABC transport system permease protein